MSAAEKLPPPEDPNVGRRLGLEAWMDLCETTGVPYERTGGVVTRPPEGMSGAAPEHNFAKDDFANRLQGFLEAAGDECSSFSSDQAVHIEAYNKDVYPDASAFCGRPEYLIDGGKKALVNPCLIVEVWSPSTKAYDSTDKFRMYQSLDSLREYVLIDPRPAFVSRFRRQETGWLMTPFSSLDDVLDLESVGVSVPLADIYRRVMLFGDSDAGE